MGTLALIGLGSNLGDRKATLDDAVASLSATPGVTVEAVSSYRETKPIGGPGGQGAFLNAAARVRTTHEPHTFLRVLHDIERLAGRVREVRWGARTLDLDLLIYGCKYLDDPNLRLPHPRLGVRRFVLEPLAEIAATIVDVVAGQSIAGLLVNLDRRPRYLALHGEDQILTQEVARRLEDPLSGRVLEMPIAEDSPDQLEARIDQLDVKHWPSSDATGSWLITSYCLAATRVSSMRDRHDKIPLQARYDRYRDLSRRKAQTIGPTFGVFLIPSERPPKAGFAWLRPESTEPNVVVAEILAACTATQAV